MYVNYIFEITNLVYEKSIKYQHENEKKNILNFIHILKCLKFQRNVLFTFHQN